MFIFNFLWLVVGFTIVVGHDHYITRTIGGKRRLCKPYYDCPPEHEILPCFDEYTDDICKPCIDGYVQPDYLSSEEDPALTKCFKNKNEDKCRETDIVPSKTIISEGCPYCKCNTSKCHYGDPCNCNTKSEGCAVGRTLHSNGTCVSCPSGTWKNTTGCGHCFHVDPVITKYIPTTKSLETTSDATNTVYSDRTSSAFQHTHVRQQSGSAMIAMIILLVILIVAFIGVLLLYFWKRRNKRLSLSENDDESIGTPLNTGKQYKMTNNTITRNTANIIDPRHTDCRQNQVQDHHTTGKQNNDYGIFKCNLVNNTERAKTLPELITEICDERHCNESKSLPLQVNSACKQTIELISSKSMPLSCSCKHTHENDNHSRETSFKNMNKTTLNYENMNHVPVCEDGKVSCVSLDLNDSNTKSISIHDDTIIHAYKKPDGSIEQVSDCLSMPVRQVSETDDPVCQSRKNLKPDIFNSIGSPSSGYDSGDFPSITPMSIDEGVQMPQSYAHLVSASDRTEKTDESITSYLENYNYSLVGLKHPAQCSRNTS